MSGAVITGVRGIVFDLDGTLVDSAPDIVAAVNAMLADLGHPPLVGAVIAGFVGNGVVRLVERTLDHVGSTARRQEALDRFRSHYDAAPANLTRPYPGVPEALEQLRFSGLPLGICTNKPEAPARALLDALSLDDFFEVVVGGDTTPHLKPDPHPLLHAFERLCVPPGEGVFVGDSEVDAETATRASIRFALHTRGYLRGPVETVTADARFGDFDALPGLLRSTGVT